MSSFYQRFFKLRDAKKSVLCVGLDPDPTLLPKGYAKDEEFEFLRDIITATKDEAIAYKPNLAFFEARGTKGISLFAQTIECIREYAKDCLIVADAKRGDLENTARFYAEAFFSEFQCDALTVHAYMGRDSLTPYLKYTDKAIFVLCLTSNKGAEDYQRLGEPPLFLRIASDMQVLHNQSGNLGLVVGATKDLKDVSDIRRVAPELLLLIPGVGAQGGDGPGIMRTVDGLGLINASRSLMYAGDNRDQVSERTKSEAKRMLSWMSPLL